MVYELEHRYWLAADREITAILGLDIKQYSKQEVATLRESLTHIVDENRFKKVKLVEHWGVYTDWYFSSNESTLLPKVSQRGQKVFLEHEDSRLELNFNSLDIAQFQQHLEAMIANHSDKEFGFRIREETVGSGPQGLDKQTQLSLEMLSPNNRTAEYDFMVQTRTDAERFFEVISLKPNLKRTKHKEIYGYSFHQGEDRYSIEVNHVWVLRDGKLPFSNLGTFFEAEIRRPKQERVPNPKVLEYIAEHILYIPAANREPRRYRQITSQLQQHYQGKA